MKSVMVIEDVKAARKEIIKKVKSTNPNLIVNETGSVKEALAMSDDKEYDAFFIDIELEDGSGLDFARELRKKRTYYFTPLVFLTGMVSKKLEAFEDVQCFGFLTKPVDEGKLQCVMDRILNEYMSTKGKDDEIQLLKNGVYRVFKSSEIVYIYSEARLIYVCYLSCNIPDKDKKVVSYKYKKVTLNKFAKQLPANFLRIHQSIIVNEKYIKEMNIPERYVRLNYVKERQDIGRSYVKKLGGEVK